MQVIENVLTAEEVGKIREVMDNGEFEDGKLTATGTAREVKYNLQLKRDNPDADSINQSVVAALLRHKMFCAWALPKRFRTPMYCKYEPGMSYGIHVDAPIMNRPEPLRTDLSITIFINNPEEYDGGELIVEVPGGEHRIKLPAGHAIAYPTVALHQVAQVTRGQRLVAVTWVQSYVHDNEIRQMLFELAAALNGVTRKISGESMEATMLRKVYNNLQRKFTDA